MNSGNAERWAAIKTIAADALEQPEAEREKWVLQRCAGDEECLAAVQRLLAFADVVNTERMGGAPRAGRFAGKRVGPYQVQWRLGEGGIGEVYLATRSEPVRMRVAMKFLRPGVATPGLLRRFQAEAQILAGLVHPNIVRLIDAGETADQEPYFVMEYVEGLPITEYCAEHQAGLSTRLRLFREICDAVQHAHSHLLVHRDLKPGNILVTSSGSVKLLDFGIAKLLRPELFSGPGEYVPTIASEQPLTPDYASPEQLRGGAIATTTDIYALGVVLFELLTGNVPFSTRNRPSWPDFVKSVREDRPPRPSASATDQVAVQFGESGSALRKRVAGDLDNIVGKALEKAPERRYQTALAFREDVQRFETGLPVYAHPDSFGYRAGKYARRHSAAIAGGMVVLLSLSGGLAVSFRSQAQARRDLAAVRQLGQAMISTFSGVESACFPLGPAKQMAQSAETALASDPKNQELQKALANGYEQLADAYRQEHQDNDARAIIQKLLNLKQRALDANPSNPALKKDYDETFNKYFGAAGVFSFGGSGTAKAAPPRNDTDVAVGLLQLGDLLRLSGDPQGAAKAYHMSADLWVALAAASPDNAGIRTLLTRAQESLRSVAP